MSDPNTPAPQPPGPDFSKAPGSDDSAQAAPPYGEQAPSYAQQPPSYTQQPGYGQPAGYGEQNQQPGYGQPAGYGQPSGYPTGPTGPGKGLAIGALILGIVAVLGAWIPFIGFFFAFLGLIAIGLGVAGAVQAGKGRAGGKGMAITGAVLGVVSIVLSIGSAVVAVTLLGSGINAFETEMASLDSSFTVDGPESMEDVLANNLDVEIGAFEVSGDPDFPDTKLPVTLTNKGTEAATFTVTISAMSGGSEIDSDLVFSDTIEPGASETLDAFEFVFEAEPLTTATFEVTDVTMYNF